MAQYSLYTVAGLDFLVEKGILEYPVFANFVPFHQEMREVGSVIFKVQRGRVVEPNAKTMVERDMEDGHYRAWISDEQNIVEIQSADRQYSCRLLSDKYWKEIVIDFGEGKPEDVPLAVKGLLLVAFTYSAAFYGTLMMHASTVRQGDWAVAFTGPSGAGKSTHSQLWLHYIPGISLLNDDQPVVRLVDGKPYLFGSPWSGKTPCYKNEKAQMLALYRMVQAKENRLTPMHARELFLTLLSSCAMIKEEVLTFGYISQTIADLCKQIKGYTLESRPVKEAALLTYEAAKELA